MKTIDKYFASVAEDRTDFGSLVRAKLQAAVLDVIDNLVELAKSAKNEQAKVAAQRQLMKVCYDLGVLAADPVRKLMDDLTDDIEPQKH
jgi:hypothetical protein